VLDPSKLSLKLFEFLFDGPNPTIQITEEFAVFPPVRFGTDRLNLIAEINALVGHFSRLRF